MSGERLDTIHGAKTLEIIKNTASGMESNSELPITSRGLISVKGKGKCTRIG